MEKNKPKKYALHKKTNKIYRVFDIDIINATNANDGQEMFLYQNNNGDMFVRELEEFCSKFESLPDTKEIEEMFKYGGDYGKTRRC